jgi:lysozyme
MGNFRRSTLLRKVNANPKDPSIRAEFKKWVRANDRVLLGLQRRRNAESKLYFTP